MIILLMVALTLAVNVIGVGIYWLCESIRDKDLSMKVLGFLSIFNGCFILSLSAFVAFLGSPS